MQFNKQRSKRKRVVRSVSLDQAVSSKIDEIAAKQNRTPSNFIETFLMEHVKALRDSERGAA